MSSLNSFRNYGIALACLLGLPLCSAPLIAQKYQITKFYIPPPPKNRPGTSTSGINLQGTVVGDFGFSEGELTYDRGFVRLPDGTLQYPIIDPNDPDGRATYLNGINDSGVMAGYYSASQEHGFPLSDGVFTDVSEIEGGSTIIKSINNNGDFCGAFGDAFAPQHGFISIGGILTQVDVPGYTGTVVTALGIDGASVGVGYSQGQEQIGFVRGSKGAMHTFEANGAGVLGTTPTGINTQAQLIVGFFYDTSFVVHGFVLHYTRPLDEVGPLDAQNFASAGPEKLNVADVKAASSGFTYITGVNADGVITGFWQDPKRGPDIFGWIGTPIQ